MALDLRTTLLQRKELLGAERLVVDLRGRLDEVLQMGAGEEISKINELAVLVIFYIDGAPSVLAATNSLPVDVDVSLGADHSEWNDGLCQDQW